MTGMKIAHGWDKPDPEPFALPVAGQSLHTGNRPNNSHGGKLINRALCGNA